MDIKQMTSKAKMFWGENADVVFDSEGLNLSDIPNIYSRAFIHEFAHSIRQIVYSDENSLSNPDFKVLQSILIQAQIVKTRYEKAEVILKKVDEKLKKHPKKLIHEDELESYKKEILNDFTLARDFVLDAELLYSTMIQVACTNSAISSGIFKDKKEFSIQELEKIDSRISEHAKKTAFDQMSLLVFGKYPEKYDQQRIIEEIDSKHKTNDFLEYRVGKKEVAFAYLDMNPLSLPKFPRSGSILSVHDGVGYPIDNITHLHKTMEVSCKIADEDVLIKVPVWYGIITTKVSDSEGKVVDLDSIFNKSAELAKENPELAKNLMKWKDNQSLAYSYIQAFEKLAESNNLSYNTIVNQLKHRSKSANK